MDFKSVRVVGDESNFHERLFFEAWMSIKDLRDLEITTSSSQVFSKR